MNETEMEDDSIPQGSFAALLLEIAREDKEFRHWFLERFDFEGYRHTPKTQEANFKDSEGA